MEATEIKEQEITQQNTEATAQAPQAPVQIPETLTPQQALQVLVDAAKVAQSKGIFTLDDAELVNKAIKAFIPKGPVASNS
jgi:hypothetical protein